MSIAYQLSADLTKKTKKRKQNMFTKTMITTVIHWSEIHVSKAPEPFWVQKTII